MSNNRVVLKRSSVSGKIPTYNTLEYGELALNYNDGKLYYRTSNDEVNYFSVLNDSLSAVLDKRSYVIDTAGTNTLTVTYEVGYVDVHVNGVRLSPSDFTATNGYQVVIADLKIGDEVTLDGYKAFQLTTATKYDRRKYTATAGQDTFTVDYEVIDVGTRGAVQVFVNGILLKESDYTATSGTEIVLSSPAELDDVVECIGYSDFSILNLQADGTGLSYDPNTGTVILDSSSNNDPSTVVLRDAYGNFAANTIVAENGVVTDSINTTANNPFTVSVDTGEGIATMTYDGSLNLGQIVVSDETQGLTLQPNTVATSGTGLALGFWATGRFTQFNDDGSIEVPGSIIPQADVAYDLGSATNRFRDLYLSGNTITLGDSTISSDGAGGVAVNSLKVGSSVIAVDQATNTMKLPADTILGDNAKLPPVDLEILPEVLSIQVSATAPGDDIVWNWTWLQSTLPYARATITNSPQLSVPLYKKGTYTLDNFIAYETFGDLTQTHPAYLKWIDGAGTDNLVSWATYVQTTSSHPDINDGTPTQVQRYTILVPEEVTLPTLTLPQGIGYGVSFDTAGSYTFGADMIESAPMQGSVMHSVAMGQNPNIGPMYRGATYTFYLDPTVENHPFYLTTDNGQGFVPGQYVGEYTSGVTGSRNNGTTGKETITFTVPMDAPDILYYQCGNHQAMRGVITIRDLAVEQNANGNYVLYFQHTHEGHKTPVEIRPIPSLVNQMCLVYSAAAGKFVPQDLSTYIENTPSFKAKIQEIAGTATLIDASGQPIVATVKIFSDPGYLPFAGNKAGDIAYTEDTNTVFIWDEKVYNWKSTKARNTDEVGEGSGNLYFTEDRVQTKLGKVSGHILPDTNLAYALGSPTHRFSEVYLSSNSVYLDEFSLSIDTGKFVVTDPSGNPTPIDLAANDTDDIAEGSTNLYYTDARARNAISASGSLNYNSSTGELSFTLPSLDTDTVTEGSNLYYTDARVRAVLTADSIANTTYVDTAISNLVDSSPATLDTLNELAAALGDDPNFATTVATNIGTKADKTTTISAGTGLTGGGDLTANRSFALATSGVTAGSYGSASTVPVITVDAYGRVTSATTTNVAGVSGFSYTAATNTYTITTSAGTSFDATGDLSSFDTADLAEGTNQYFTTARARSSISVSGSLAYNSSTGVISYTTPTTIASLSNHTTTNLAEGTNLYYTDARARASISASGSLSYNSSTGELSFTLPPLDTDTVTEASNLYFTTARARESISATGSLSYNSTTGVISFTQGNTDTVSEGTTNQYFTTARARESISATGSLSYNSTTGVISYTAPTAVSAFTNDAGYITSSASIAGNAATATKLATARTLALSGDVTGSVTFDGSANATITATIAADSVALGTDTTGNYVAGLTAGTGITISGTAGEGWSPTVAVDSTIATKSYADAAASAVQTAILGGAGAAYDTLQEIKTLMDSADASLQTAINNLTIGNGTQTITAGGGISGGGSFTANQTGNSSVTISHADTSTAANLTAGSRTYVTGLTFDTYGHVTGYTTGTETVVDTNTTYTAGSGLTLTGTTFSHTDTSSVANLTAATNTFVTGVTFDTYGHVTAISTGSPSGFLTAESDTLATVTSRGDSTSTQVALNGGFTSQSILLNGAQNFDSLKSSGFYSLYNVNAAGHTNAPFQYGAMISANNTASAYGMGLQLAHERTGAGTYIRGMNDTNDTWYAWQRMYMDNYHPLADKWTTARTLSLSGAVTGSATIDGSGNVDIATTATSDPTLTLTGDVSGSATFTNLGNATLTATVADDSHNHTSLTGVTSISFAAEASDSMSISRTINGSGTYFDFNLTDDNNNDWWRWRFTPSGSTVYDAMVLKPVSNGNADLTVSGIVTADSFSGNASSASKWATARTLTLTGDVTGSVSMDGSGDVSMATAVGDDSHDHTKLFDRSLIEYGQTHFQVCDISGQTGTGYNGSTPYNPTNDWYHHLISNHSNSGGYYVDLALCFHTNNHYITRLVNGTRSTVKLWNDGNDGAGSGLDADTLDGIDSTGFCRYFEQSTNPGTVANGSIWVNTVTGLTYMRQQSVWVQINPSSSGVGIYDVNGTKVN